MLSLVVENIIWVGLEVLRRLGFGRWRVRAGGMGAFGGSPRIPLVMSAKDLESVDLRGFLKVEGGCS